MPVADIGTDHAYLPAALAASGKSPRCIACDLNPGPLARAENTVRKYGLEDRIELRLSDGLAALHPGEAEDIVLAGMGGGLIFQIINRCEWIKSGNVRLILQPMTSQDDLRGSLSESGFELNREAVAKEGGKLYLVMAAVYTGNRVTPSGYFKIAGLLPSNNDSLSREYLNRQAQILRKAAAGRRMARQRDVAASAADEPAALEALAARIQAAALRQ